MRQTDKIAAANPQAAAKPGGWARALLGGVSQALGGLGDARDAGSGDAKTTGWLQGVTSTLGNREARISAQNQQAAENARKDKELAGVSAEQKARIDQMAATTAHENAMAVHESKVWSQLDDESKKKAIAQDKNDLDEDQSGELPAPILARDIDSDELMKQIKAGGIDPTKAHRYLTGQKEVGENLDGTPIMRDVYTITGQGEGPQKISADFAKRYNSAFPDRPPLPTDGTGTTDWHTLKYNQQLVSNVETAKLIREDNERKLGIEREKEETTAESNDLQKDTRYLKFMGAAKLNPIVAYQMAANDPTMTKDYPRLLKDFSVAVGPNVWDEYVKNATTAHGEAAKALDKLENDPAELSGDKAPAAIATAQARLGDPLTPPEEKTRWTRVLSQAQSALQLTTQNKVNEKRAEQAITAGDPKVAGKQLADRTVTIPDLKTRGATPEWIESAIAEAKQIDPTFKAPVAEGQANVAKTPQQAQFFGSTDSLIKKGGMLDQLDAVGASLGNTSIPKLNTMAQWTEAAAGSGPIAGYAATALGLADDYSKVMTGGQGSDTSRLQALNLLNAAQSPDQRKAVLKQLRQQIVSQRTGRTDPNLYLKDMYPMPAQSTDGTPNAPAQVPPQTQSVGHKVGDVIVQNGQSFTVTSVDASGKVTGAN
jgi:hypothetical protein